MPTTEQQILGTRTAWEMIGYDGPNYVRIKGGRALYEAVMFNEATGRQQKVLLARLEARETGIAQINRYVDPDTIIEEVG